MGKIVKFPIERTNCRQVLPVSGSADIVIFPGVRIERREFSLADRHAKIARTLSTTAVAKNPNR